MNWSLIGTLFLPAIIPMQQNMLHTDARTEPDLKEESAVKEVALKSSQVLFSTTSLPSRL